MLNNPDFFFVQMEISNLQVTVEFTPFCYRSGKQYRCRLAEHTGITEVWLWYDGNIWKFKDQPPVPNYVRREIHKFNEVIEKMDKPCP